MQYREENFIEWEHHLRKLEMTCRTDIQQCRATQARLSSQVVEYQNKATQKGIMANRLARSGIVLGGRDMWGDAERAVDQQAAEERRITSIEKRQLEIAKQIDLLELARSRVREDPDSPLPKELWPREQIETRLSKIAPVISPFATF